MKKDLAASGTWRKMESAGPLASLEDLDDGSEFDQFKGKKSTYRDELYTTRIDETRITREL
jgi:hypothetical protein